MVASGEPAQALRLVTRLTASGIRAGDVGMDVELATSLNCRREEAVGWNGTHQKRGIPMKSSRETVVPAARSDGLVVEHLAGETLIYDLERDEAHHLNPTATVVFELCDGRSTVKALAARVGERVGHPVSAETAMEALEQLAAFNLLVGAPAMEAGVSRREVVRKAALVGAGAAAAAPLIKSIVAPTPAMAQSRGAQCIPFGETGCGVDADCCQAGENGETNNLFCFDGTCTTT